MLSSRAAQTAWDLTFAVNAYGYEERRTRIGVIVRLLERDIAREYVRSLAVCAARDDSIADILADSFTGRAVRSVR